MSFYAQPGWTTGSFKGKTYRYLSIKPSGPKPVLLLIHGFPSGPMTFRPLIALLIKEGYGVIAPELLGYGETDKPTDVQEYSGPAMSDQLAAILDKEKVESVVVVGHDHGSALASSFVRLHPKRSIALVLCAVWDQPPNPEGMNAAKVNAMALPLVGYETLGYWEFFAKSSAPAVILEHLDSFISILYAKDPAEWATKFAPTGALEKNLMEDHIYETAAYLPDSDKAELKEFLQHGGLAGPLKWYEARVKNVSWEGEKEISARLSLPYLFIATLKDGVCIPIFASGQVEHCDDLTVKEFNTGHWVCEEDPQGVLEAITEFLDAKKLLSK